MILRSKNQTRAIHCVAAISLSLALPSVLQADAGHSHHATAPVTPGSYTTVGQAWTQLQGHAAHIEDLASGSDLKALHEPAEAVAAALAYLGQNSPMVEGDQQKRLESAIKQAGELAKNVHVAADAGDKERTGKEIKKLQAALKLVAAQYPAEALTADATAVKYECPMKDFTGDAPGKCPKCGMELKPVSTGADEHGHGSAEPTMSMNLATATPLKVGEKAEVTVSLKKKDGSPVTLEELKEAHTEKIHVLVIDPSLTDYHHEHPVGTDTPGEFKFSFTPKKPGAYRVWADLLPVATGAQEYVMADIPADTLAEPVTNRAESLSTQLEGLTYTLTFKEPLKAGSAALGTLTITDEKGQVYPSLEPVMGAYAHIVGFGEDFKTIAHIHPMGPEPTQATDRGKGTLEFHLQPESPGLLRLFAQVQIGGTSKFAPFTLNIGKADESAGASSNPHTGHSH
jgi:hypothetical protein